MPINKVMQTAAMHLGGLGYRRQNFSDREFADVVLRVKPEFYIYPRGMEGYMREYAGGEEIPVFGHPANPNERVYFLLVPPTAEERKLHGEALGVEVVWVNGTPPYKDICYSYEQFDRGGDPLGPAFATTLRLQKALFG